MFSTRCVEQILRDKTEQCEVWASYLQIYCETITDLLWQNGFDENVTDNNYDQSRPLAIRERSDGHGVVCVEGLSKFSINNLEDLWDLLQKGDKNRATASTNMNETSSRSHAVLIIKIIIKDNNSSVSYRESTLMLVDLAGSERATASEGRVAMRLEEAKAINLSLSALGNCMNALAEGRPHIPYRDAKLTRLLQGCLGGSARTAVGM